MKLLTFVSALLRIFILIKVSYLLFMTNLYPNEYPLSLLNWWIYYLIFDIWLLTTYKTEINPKND
jgi:hypothetical protein